MRFGDKHSTTTLLSTTALLLLCGGAHAQTTPAQVSDQIDEVVVTALRDRTNVQSAPAAVTAVSGEMLERQKVTDVRGLQNLVPSAKFSAANTSTRIYIRGVGSALDFYWIPETTAVNLNGVYVPRYATTGGLFDIESVQILPGPQGVLYGRSAGGGAVVINTKRPTSKDEASGSFEFGNYDAIRIEAMGNVAVSDDLAMRGAVSLSKRDGYQPYGLQSDDSFSARLSALYKPTDDLSVYVWATRFKQTGKPTAAQYLPYLPGPSPWYVPPFDPVTGASNMTGSYADYEYSIGGGELQYDFGGVQLTYTASILNQTEHALRKLVGNDQVINNDQDQYTQDLRLSGDAGRLSWIGGVNWFYASSNHDVRFGPRQFGQDFDDIKQKSLSGFFQGTWKLSDDVRLVGGGRYTRDSLEVHGTGIACFAACAYPPIDFDDSWRHFDWKVGVEWDVAPRVLAYANVQSGYAPGTLNTYTNTTTFSKEIKPQTLVAYTGGLKTQTADRVFTANLEGFYYQYEDLIIQAFNASLGQPRGRGTWPSRASRASASAIARPPRVSAIPAICVTSKRASTSCTPTPTTWDWTPSASGFWEPRRARI